MEDGPEKSVDLTLVKRGRVPHQTHMRLGEFVIVPGESPGEFSVYRDVSSVEKLKVGELKCGLHNENTEVSLSSISRAVESLAIIKTLKCK